jgi:hypothetical protein
LALAAWISSAVLPLAARTVTLWIGTEMTFSTVSVSMSTVALMPGRSFTSRSLMRS